MSRHSVRLFPAAILVTGLALLLIPAPAYAGKAADGADPMPMTTATAVFAEAKAKLKDTKANFDDIRNALNELTDAHARVAEDGRAKYRRGAEALLLKAFMLVKQKTRKGPNLRVDVNVLAGELLGKTAAVLDVKERKALSLKLRALIVEIEKKKRRWAPELWNQEHMEAGFAALAALNHHDALVWMAHKYSHTNERQIAFVIGALSAMPKFKKVPGKIRWFVCDEMRKAYVGVESAAERSSNDPADQAKKRIWDRLRTYVIPVMQHFAGRPKNEKGEALSSMREFRDWLMDHKEKHAVWMQEI